MSVVSGHVATRLFSGSSSVSELEGWTAEAAAQLSGPAVFGLVFATPEYVDEMDEIIEILRIYGRVPTVLGCCAHGLIEGDRENENEPGLAVALYAFPDTRVQASVITEADLEAEDREAALRLALGPEGADANGYLLFASPVGMSDDAWLVDWDRACGRAVTVGGFVSSDPRAPSPALFLNGEALTSGAVALGLHGRVGIEPLLSQGCRPVGAPWIVTDAERNVIRKIGNRPILEVLRDTLEGMTRREQQQARGNIFIGLVLDEYKSSFGTGDFLVRNLAAIDPQSGAVAIATLPRVGQNLQFQIRDAHTASVDFEMLLEARALALRGRAVYGACLCDCIGRGASLFGVPDHDAKVVREVFPELPLTGFFCNGEFGPGRQGTLLHGYAASMAIFTDRA